MAAYLLICLRLSLGFVADFQQCVIVLEFVGVLVVGYVVEDGLEGLVGYGVEAFVAEGMPSGFSASVTPSVVRRMRSPGRTIVKVES